jgi:hypothetical protein
LIVNSRKLSTPGVESTSSRNNLNLRGALHKYGGGRAHSKTTRYINTVGAGAWVNILK